MGLPEGCGCVAGSARARTGGRTIAWSPSVSLGVGSTVFFFPSLLSFELEEARVILILFLYLKPNLDPAVPSWSPPRNPIPITLTFPGYVFLSAFPFGFVFYQCPDLAVLPSLPDSLHVRVESSCALKKVSLNRSQLSFVPLSCGAGGSPAVVLLTTESLLF